ncbi:MAG: TldD protein [Planctomycetota bacterium]|jgi:TldD protein
MKMKQAQAAVEAALKAGADYADARANQTITEELVYRNGAVAVADAPDDSGLGVRVMKDGCWGFAAASVDSLSGAEQLAQRALKVSRELSPARTEPVRLVPNETGTCEWSTPLEIDPFSVSLSDKLDMLTKAEASMAGAEETVIKEAGMSLRQEEQWMASSDGAEIYQKLVRCGAGISTTASANGTTQRRSYPASFGGNPRSAGYEHILGLDLASHGARMRDESVQLCSADPCPEGERDLILMGNQLMLQIHESVGHPNELDRVFGHEVDLAGSSFATTDKLGSFQYGSDIVNLVADSTIPGGLDTRAYDDDGVASQRWHVVENGVFKGYHTNREWADSIGEAASRGTNRAEGWYNPPIIRITNLSLMPGEWTLDNLIADTEDGVLLDTVKMWSIDQRRLNFQFTSEIAWEIKDGVRGRILRDPTYQGTTPEFWRSCDAICNEDHWELWGVANCGKGNPMQVAEMSHGASPARFRKMSFVR